jgi:hypothetical protein
LIASTHTRQYAAKPVFTRDDSVSACIYEPCAATARADCLTCPFTSKRGLCNRLTAE